MDEYDEKVFHSFRLILREVANVYVSVYDTVCVCVYVHVCVCACVSKLLIQLLSLLHLFSHHTEPH